MIFVLTTARHDYAFAPFLEEWEPELAPRVRMLAYETLFKLTLAPPGTYLFTDIERLTRPEKAAAQLVWDQLSASGRARCLNRPDRFLDRFPLLRMLYETRQNQFQVYRPWELHRIARFPVFVRQLYEHDGNLTPLLHTRSDVVKALGSLRLRGHAVAKLIIVEYCDVSDAEGVSCKYGIFKIGDRVFPRHVQCSKDWMVKVQSDDPKTVRLAGEEEWFEAHPHEAWARRVFELAGVDYARVDYGVSRNGPQLWEVNTNPVVINPKKAMDPSRIARRARVMGRLREALEEIDDIPPSAGAVRVRIPLGLRALALTSRALRDGRESLFKSLVEAGASARRSFRRSDPLGNP